MSSINLPKELNTEQKVLLERYAAKWERIAFCREVPDRNVAEGAIREAYSNAGLDTPQIVWCGSPLTMLQVYGFMTGLAFIHQHKKALEVVQQAVGDIPIVYTGAIVTDKVYEYPVKQLEPFIYRQHVSGYFVGNVGDGQVGVRLHSEHPSAREVMDAMRFDRQMTRLNMIHNDRVVIESDKLSTALQNKIIAPIYSVAGAMQFLYQVMGVKEFRILQPFWQMVQHASWWLPCEKMCFVSDAPDFINFDSDGNLHSTTGAAYSYPDGWGVYAWHGRLIDKEYINHPELITVAQIDSERNLEIKRTLIELYGLEHYMEKGGYQVIAKDEYGELVRKEQGVDEPIVMVRVFNGTPESDGTRKVYWLPVPPRFVPPEIQDSGSIAQHVASRGRLWGWGSDAIAREWRSPKEAIAWTFGLSEQQYQPLQET